MKMVRAHGGGITFQINWSDPAPIVPMGAGPLIGQV